MIPPYKSNHASFLELLPANGILIMSWFSGTSEGADKCSIVTAYVLTNSTQWSNATVVSQREGYSNQNPVLYYDTSTNLLNLFHTQQKADDLAREEKGVDARGGRGDVGTREETSHIWHMTLNDFGRKNSEPQEIFAKDGSFDRNRIIKSVMDGGSHDCHVTDT